MMNESMKAWVLHGEKDIRLEERKRVLAGEIRRGNTDVVDAFVLLERRLAGMKPPDTRHLDARAKELTELERAAPIRVDPSPSLKRQ